jgi:hypothetical protein
MRLLLALLICLTFVGALRPTMAAESGVVAQAHGDQGCSMDHALSPAVPDQGAAPCAHQVSDLMGCAMTSGGCCPPAVTGSGLAVAGPLGGASVAPWGRCEQQMRAVAPDPDLRPPRSFFLA